MGKNDDSSAAASSAARLSLSDQQDLLRNLIESSVDGILAFDCECHYTVWNPAMERISGVTAADTVGRSAFEVFPFLRDIGEDQFFYAALEGKNVIARDRPFVIPETGKQGFFEGYYSPLRDQGGKVVGGLAIIRDITERKRANETLEAQARILESMAEGVNVSDAQGNLTYTNPAFERMFGYEPDELIGQPVSALNALDQPDNDELVRTVLAHLASHGHWAGEFLNRRKDGSTFTTQATISSLQLDGESHYVSVQEDVTEHKVLEEKLQQSQKMEAVGRLAGGIAHDFNNILSGILGWAEILQLSVPDNEEVRSMADEILSCGARASALTHQLLSFSRGEVAQAEVLDVNAAIRSAERLLSRLIQEDISFVLDLEPEPLYVRIDPVQLEQMIVNLALNSRDAMPKGGRITIASALDADGDSHRVALSVKDTGSGMDEQTIARIFEPFFTTKARGKGTGLGLSTVYASVTQADGHVAVESAPGRGATFRVVLPRVRGEGKPVDERHPKEQAPQGSETIMLVEDDSSVRRLAVQVLERAGYNVLSARDGVEALELADAYPNAIELLVADVVLPRLGGGELAERLTAARSQLKVLFMTGYSEDSLVEHRLDERLATLLRKPFTPTELAHRVRDVLDGG